MDKIELNLERVLMLTHSLWEKANEMLLFAKYLIIIKKKTYFIFLHLKQILNISK
jgi:hypothetical protein